MFSCYNAIYLKDLFYTQMQHKGPYLTSSAKMVKTMLALNFLLAYRQKNKKGSFKNFPSLRLAAVFILVTHLPVRITLV